MEETLEGSQEPSTLSNVEPEPLTPRVRVGEVLADRYAVLGDLGHGGMGQVVRAYDSKLEREVALKRILPNRADPTSEARLEREAQAMAKLNAPNVVAVYDVVSLDPGLAIAMEYVKGRTLRSWMRDRRDDDEPPTWREVLDKFIPAGRGLAAAHRRELVHRDFKPGNVLLSEDGDIKVTDFGLVKLGDHHYSKGADDDSSASTDSLGSSDELTRAGEVLGTPRYMAPEQHQGQDETPAADQFAFCIALREALTGRPPYQGSLALLAKLKAKGPPEWPASAKLPRRLKQALDRGLQADPQQRYPTVDALLEDLESARRTQSRTAWLWMGGAVAIGGGLFATSASKPGPCTGADEAIQTVWNDARRSELADRFAALQPEYATQTWTALDGTVGEYASSWTESYTEACEATRLRQEQSQRVMQLRMNCLHDARTDLDGRLRALDTIDADSLERAHRVLEDLPAPSACDDPRLLGEVERLPAPEIADQVSALSAQLALADATRTLRSDDSTLEQLQQLLQDAEALAHVPLLVRAQQSLADELIDHERFDEAQPLLQHAHRVATESGSLARQISIVETLVYLCTRSADAQAGPWAAATLEGLIARPGVDASVRLMANLAISSLWSQLRDDPRAIETAVAANELLALVDDPDGARAAAVAERMGVSLAFSDPKRAMEMHQRALDLHLRRLGPDHPDVGLSYASLGVAQGTMGLLDEADASLRAALAIFDRTMPASRAWAIATNNLATILWRRGELDGAAELLADAQRYYIDFLGPDHPDTLAIKDNSGLLERARGNYSEAARIHSRVAAARAETLGDEHSTVATSQAHAAEALLDLGQDERAWELLYKAKDADLDTAPLIDAMIHLSLGQLEVSMNSDDSAAYDHFYAAEKLLEDMPDHAFLVIVPVGYAEVELLRNDGEAALKHVTEAQKRYEAIDGAGLDEGMIGEMEWVRARAWQDLGQMPRAQASARKALRKLPDRGRYAQSRKTIEAWLAQR